jgi:hypothetical protein
VDVQYIMIFFLLFVFLFTCRFNSNDSVSYIFIVLSKKPAASKEPSGDNAKQKK